MDKKNKNFKKKVKDIYKGEYDYIGKDQYENNKSIVTIRHNVCGHEYDVRAMYFTRKTNPVLCRCQSKTYMDTNKFKKQVYDLVKDEYIVLGEYVDYKTNILMKHTICGHEWEVKPSNFTSNNTRCPKCASYGKYTHEDFLNKLSNDFINEYEILDKYINSNTPIRFKHITCGHEWSTTPNMILNDNTRCPKCSHRSYRKTTKEFEKEVSVLTEDEYIVLGEYIDSKTPILMKHDVCGHEWKVRPNNFLSTNTRCPICIKYRKEYEVYKYLETFVKEDIVLNDRTVLDGKELDIYIPDLNIAIEFNGLYWHSDKFKDKNYHINKTNKCKEKDIQLIHIMEDEWMNKQEIVKSKLKHILNYNNNPRVYARSCYIDNVSKNDKRDFLNTNHIQGNDKSSIELGLYRKSDNKLVSIMTFCKSRLGIGFSKGDYHYELSRFASDINYLVVGGYSKLLKYFLRNYKYDKITTYADLRWSNIDNNMYNDLFNLIHITEPNYWYADKENRYHRFNYRKGNLKEIYPDLYDDKLTEFEIMDKTNMYRIYDCGVATYEIEN